MNEYVLHEMLLSMENVSRQYSDGGDCAARVREIVDRMTSQQYRVAVIGEFKRGKSSLINAIIGASVLPTDILPMTAAVTRVTYGEKRRILIRYKNGTEQERTVEELIDFATKFDAEKERTAASIQEIEVTYPSVFCKNHIDILDTPGLNDNEAMTDVTLGVLGDVDAAIMVISAKMPLSITEQNLILDMISRPQIRHIIFVVTHIDAVSSRTSQQDKMIRFIASRLSGEVLEQATTKFAGQEKLVTKAVEVLQKPDIFGVSSVLAMDGFIHDDEELLEQSRFPDFKRELLALLTAAQTGDVEAKTVEAAMEVRDSLDWWFATEQGKIQDEAARHKARRDACAAYAAGTGDTLQVLLKTMDRQLADKGLDEDGMRIPQLEQEMRRAFIQHLSALRLHTNLDINIRAAIDRGAREARTLANAMVPQMEQWVRQAMAELLEEYGKVREECGFAPLAPENELLTWGRSQFPEFGWTETPIPPVKDLKGVDVMPQAAYAVTSSLNALAREIRKFIASWRLLLEQQCSEDQKDTTVWQQVEEELTKLQTQENLLRMKHILNEQKIAEIMTKLDIPAIIL